MFVDVHQGLTVSIAPRANALMGAQITESVRQISLVNVTADFLVSTALWLTVHLVVQTMGFAEMASATATKVSMGIIVNS